MPAWRDVMRDAIRDATRVLHARMYSYCRTCMHMHTHVHVRVLMVGYLHVLFIRAALYGLAPELVQQGLYFVLLRLLVLVRVRVRFRVMLG